MKKRVTAIGGIFFKSKEPKKIYDWYAKHLGITSNEYGSVFKWRHIDDQEKTGYTVWSAFKEDTKYFDPGKKEFMINYHVENLEELLKTLEKEGVTIVGKMEEYSYGKFGWILDPEGNKIELFEPTDEMPEKEA
ncbi:MAG: VOC family protein [Chitinophagaceae bacterium]|nr:VOC family protein [Chitinophagaceae bacterium]